MSDHAEFIVMASWHAIVAIFLIVAYAISLGDCDVIAYAFGWFYVFITYLYVMRFVRCERER